MSYSPDQRINTAIREIERSAALNPAIKALLKRENEIGGKTTAVLAGIALHPPARQQFEKELDRIWASNVGIGQPEEIIIGAGPHAAIYAATRVQMGYAPPLILTKDRVGGSFATSIEPSFYLNSRNRPGPLSLPLQGGALNVIPGSQLQPSHISNDEYQRNSDLAFVVRSAIALSGARVLRSEAVSITGAYDGVRVGRKSSTSILTRRVIVATGLGAPQELPGQKEAGGKVDTFDSFMRRFDQPFPLQGLERVAVIGAGDSGRTVIEALTGMGPQAQMSVAALDYPRQIDWYGVGAEMTCESFADRVRSRYKGLASLLPSGTGRNRVTPRANCEALAGGFDCVYVDERPYDHVIVCIGPRESANPLLSNFNMGEYLVGGRRVAKNYGGLIFLVGPAAELPLDEREDRSIKADPIATENKTAMFRYADRTAALAASLPGRKIKKAKAKKVARPKKNPPLISVEQDNAGYWILKQNGREMPGERNYSVKENAVGRARWITNGRKSNERDYS